MNTKYENTKSVTFAFAPSDAFDKNYDIVKNNTAKPEEKVFKIAKCNRCIIKVSTHNGRCPSCNEPVEV